MRATPPAREAVRYLANARHIVREAPLEGDTYVDVKPIREALGTAYRAVLEAINEALIRRGLTKRELPKSVDAYRLALQRHLGAHNGRLARDFERLYDALHIFGYYRGSAASRRLVKAVLDDAQAFIERLA